MNVLLIDYRKEELAYISDLLESIAEIKNVSAFDGFQKAQQYFEQHPTDLVLLDADHEQISWTIFYKKIKSINSTAKVVLMSADDTAAVRAYEVGVWDYLLKPVEKKQMKRVIEKAIYT